MFVEQLKPEEGTEILRESLLTILTYSLSAVAIFVIGRFSWWLGLVGFLIFAGFVLSRFVLVGLVFLIEVLIMRFSVRYVRVRGLRPSKFDKVLHHTKGLLWMNIVLGSTEAFLLLVTIALGISIFRY